MSRVPRLNGMDSSAPSRCTRCNGTGEAFIMSFFNTDWVCLKCEKDERELPTYGAAREAELLAIKDGQRNFPGIGLTREDWSLLMAKIERRNDA